MKKIKIKDKIVLVDDDDYEKVSIHRWYVSYNKDNNFYIKSTRKKSFFIHRFIMGLEKGDKRVVDHKNHNTLDNRKKNLRICTVAENSRNRKIQKNNTSGFNGVSYFKNLKLWTVKIRLNKKYMHLGYFKTSQEASKVYNKKAKELFGEFYNKKGAT